jgi:hypothetical protein
LAADLLQTVINDAKNQGLLNLPLPHRAGNNFPIVQYADDTILVMEACPDQLAHLKSLLHSFAASTGLKVNYNKSVMVPLNITEEKLETLSQLFGCQKGSLPNIQDFLPLMQKIEKRLTSTSTFLYQGGKLEMVNLFFHPRLSTILHGPWRGSDFKKPSKAAWPMVCLPKKQGGLGVINLTSHNNAMLLKFLHKFFSKLDIPWVKLIWDNYYQNGRLPRQQRKGSFWWKDVVKLLAEYKDLAKVTIGDGSTVFFWKDSWNGTALAQAYPELSSFANNINVSFLEATSKTDLAKNFILPVSVQAHQQLMEIINSLEDLPIGGNVDIWTYKWGNANFSTSKAYKALIGEVTVHPIYNWL